RRQQRGGLAEAARHHHPAVREGLSSYLESACDIGKVGRSGAPRDIVPVRTVGGVAYRLQARLQVRRQSSGGRRQRLPGAGAERPGSGGAGRGGAGGGPGGPPSSTTWPLVPPMPNELTPARRGAPPSSRPGQGQSSDATRSGVCSQAIRGLGWAAWRLGGISP